MDDGVSEGVERCWHRGSAVGDGRLCQRSPEACANGDPRAAVSHIARHLSKIAFSLLADTVPEREPATVRAALQIALAQAGNTELESARSTSR